MAVVFSSAPYQTTGAADVRWYGARGGASILRTANTTISITSGTPALNVVGGSFTASDVGKQIRVPFAGAAGGMLSTTIVGYTSATQITLAANASTTVSAVQGPIVYGWDDTAAFQRALAASNDVYVPPGQYFVTDTLVVRASCRLAGSPKEVSLIVRTDAYSHTITLGTPSVAGQAARVENLYLMEAQYWTDGVTTKLPFAASAGAAHIAAYGAQLGAVKNCMLSYMPYGIRLFGTTLFEISGNQIFGVWDRTNTDLQEQLAGIRTEYSATFGSCKDVNIIDNPNLGGKKTSSSFTYTSTCGSSAQTIVRPIGGQHGIWLLDAENFNISGNYFGAHSFESLLVENTNVAASIRVSNNFFDDPCPNRYSIKITSDNSSRYVLNTAIVGNNFNGQLSGYGAITIDYPTWMTAYNVTIAGNTFNAHVGTPINIQGARGVSISGNTISNYNCLNLCAADPAYAAGIFLGSPTSGVTLSGNTWGGGGNTNDPVTANYCSWAIYSDTASFTYSGEQNLGVNTAFTGGTAATAAAISGPVTLNGTATIASGKALKLGNAYVAGAPAATGYLTVQDSNGATYKILAGT